MSDQRTDRPVRATSPPGYSGTPLPQKLQIREGSTVAFVGAPPGFISKLTPLPAGVRVQKEVSGAKVILAFMKSAAMLGRGLPALAGALAEGRTLWLIWPKKASGMQTDLSEREVRERALAAGLVDYKVCAVDETWSGLAFAVRRAKR